ncbi:MAG: ribonuclease HI [Firmicutes bacterium]|nr:ribonuclease HI [Bacillota bacterium]MCL2256487.1 ribonuclease HI [Bacillota bacterium]
MKKIHLYTDGACSGNPGRGGWAAILIYNGHEKEISGYDKNTTNNRMEMFAVIQGLAQLKEACDVTIYSDSAYVVNAFNEGWIYSWQKNNWKTADKKDVKNKELWLDLMLKMKGHKVVFVKVRGHSDDELNNRCDYLAKKAITDHFE